MEFLTEVFLNLDDQDLFELWIINETTQALLEDNYIIGQRVEYRGYSKTAWRNLLADYPELRLTCLHYLDYTVIKGALFLENYTPNDLILEEIVVCLYSDVSQMCHNSFNILINYVRKHSMWLIPSKIELQTGTIQEWTPLNSGLFSPCNTSERWILNPVLIKSIIVILKRVRKRVTSTDELQYIYRYKIEPLWAAGMKHSGSYSEAQIQELCDLLFWFWIPDPESDDKPIVPIARLFFSKEIIVGIICCSEHEALMDLLVANQPIIGVPDGQTWLYRCSVHCPNLMMLRKLIRAGHLQNGIFLNEMNEWLQKHLNSKDLQEQDQFISVIRGIVVEGYTAGMLKRIWADPLSFNKRFGGHFWSNFFQLYLVAYSWVFEKRMKNNEDLSNMYLSPEFIQEAIFNLLDQDALLKMLDFVEHPMSIRVTQADTPKVFCERMRVKLGWLNVNRASLATRLHFHPKVSRVEYETSN